MNVPTRKLSLTLPSGPLEVAALLFNQQGHAMHHDRFSGWRKLDALESFWARGTGWKEVALETPVGFRLDAARWHGARKGVILRFYSRPRKAELVNLLYGEDVVAIYEQGRWRYAGWPHEDEECAGNSLELCHLELIGRPLPAPRSRQSALA